MSRNGSGTYSLPAGNPVVTATTITSTWANSTLSDLATAMTNSIASDGQTPITANLPMTTYRHTNVGAGVALTDYARMDQVQNSSLVYLTSVSGTDTITAAASPTPSAYAAGQAFRFVAAGANTGAVTLNISSLGAKAVTKNGSTALSAGDIANGAVVDVVYDGTRFQVGTSANATGSVTSVAQSFTGGLISVAGSPITSSGTLALTVAGTSGGIPYFSSSSAWASSGALSAGAIVVGGGAGAAPTVVAAGATTEILVGGGAATAPVWTTATGSGAPVRATSPSLTTPTLGVATATSINKVAFTAPASGSTLTIADGKTFTASNTLTLTGTDSTSFAFPSTSSTVVTTGNTGTLTKGFSCTPYNGGTVSSGTYTPAASDGGQQYITNGGAFTLAPPSTATTILLEILNNGSAGTITTSGFTKVAGDSLTTANGSKFLCNIVKTQNYSLLQVQALQ